MTKVKVFSIPTPNATPYAPTKIPIILPTITIPFRIIR